MFNYQSPPKHKSLEISKTPLTPEELHSGEIPGRTFDDKIESLTSYLVFQDQSLQIIDNGLIEVYKQLDALNEFKRTTNDYSHNEIMKLNEVVQNLKNDLNNMNQKLIMMKYPAKDSQPLLLTPQKEKKGHHHKSKNLSTLEDISESSEFTVSGSIHTDIS